jgi:DNA-binding MarR family transcriptional regulator
VTAEDGGLRHDPETAGLLRLWLRLLGTVGGIERDLAKRLRQHYRCSLARFDLLAQLDRHPAGLTMSELGERLMVTGGNVTGLVRRLEHEGLVTREAVDGDRRLQRVRATAKGQALFARMARDHGVWVRERLGHLAPAERDALMYLLRRLRRPETSRAEVRRVAS